MRDRLLTDGSALRSHDIMMRRMGRGVRRTRWMMGIAALGLVSGCGRSADSPPSSPYPPSDVIAGIEFDWSTLRQLAPGSDNWPLTWAADGHQYTSWGDGGGFGGTNRDGRVSLGVARVGGDAGDYVGVNVWGGKNASHPATFGGKSYGLLALDGSLYMWRSGDASDNTAYKFQRLYRSDDQGATWQAADWCLGNGRLPTREELSDADRLLLFVPAFLQAGKEYADAADDHVYVYAPRLTAGDSRWQNQKPGEIYLLRAPRQGLMDSRSYEIFRINEAGEAGWNALAPEASGEIVVRRSQATPVFADPHGVMRTAVVYNPGLKRYLLTTEHAPRSEGNLGVFESESPWGPWRTVLYANGWGGPRTAPTSFYWNFSSKWMSEDGREFVMVFTGKQESDAWNSVAGRFVVAED